MNKRPDAAPHSAQLLEQLSRDLQAQKRHLRKLCSVVQASKKKLPEGFYDEESGEPLDLPAAFESLYEMLAVDYFEEVAAHLARAESWLAGAPLPVETNDLGSCHLN